MNFKSVNSSSFRVARSHYAWEVWKRIFISAVWPTIYTNLSWSYFFTISAEILARLLANFYCQYADRLMNLKFMRRVSERERAIRPFVIVKNKLMSVFNESVLLCATRHNIHMYPLLSLRRDSPPKSSPTFSVRPRSSVGRVTVDLIRRSWVRFPPRSKDFFFTSCGSLIPFTRANAQWVIHGFN